MFNQDLDDGSLRIDVFGRIQEFGVTVHLNLHKPSCPGKNQSDFCRRGNGNGKKKGVVTWCEAGHGRGIVLSQEGD